MGAMPWTIISSVWSDSSHSDLAKARSVSLALVWLRAFYGLLGH